MAGPAFKVRMPIIGGMGADGGSEIRPSDRIAPKTKLRDNAGRLDVYGMPSRYRSPEDVIVAETAMPHRPGGPARECGSAVGSDDVSESA